VKIGGELAAFEVRIQLNETLPGAKPSRRLLCVHRQRRTGGSDRPLISLDL
jgi:hypothetical protein